MQRVTKANFAAAWDEYGDNGEAEETYFLTKFSTLDGISPLSIFFRAHCSFFCSLSTVRWFVLTFTANEIPYFSVSKIFDGQVGLHFD